MKQTPQQKKIESLNKKIQDLELQNLSFKGLIKEMEEEEQANAKKLSSINKDISIVIKEAKFYKEAAETFKFKYEALNEAIKCMAAGNSKTVLIQSNS